MGEWFDNPVSQAIWHARYQAEGEPSVEDTWRRVASFLAAREPNSAVWERRFLDALTGFRFVPGGRVIAGSGVGGGVTLVNCFASEPALPNVQDELRHLATVARTLEFGGGVGCDFSQISATGEGAGVAAYLRLWDAAAAIVSATGARRGALLATLRFDHPDIDAFVAAKNDIQALNHFNLSVLMTDAAMRMEQGAHDATLLQRIGASAWRHGEPGVLFVDRINEENNLWYAETIGTANPCGEVPLPAHGSCILGSVNLTQILRDPLSDHASLDFAQLRELVAIGVRMLDNVIDVANFPLPEQARYARRTRRIGVGVMGLADVLAMLGHPYGTPEAVACTERIMSTICETAYATSIEIAAEKGSFAALDPKRFLLSGFARRLPAEIRRAIEAGGIRNSHLVAIAPTGTISLLANNVSSGIEPVIAPRSQRRIVNENGNVDVVELESYAHRAWRRAGGAPEGRPEFRSIDALTPADHIAIQAAAQPFVDNAIAKTVNLAAGSTVEDVIAVFQAAHRAKLKGCTVFRSGGARCPIVEPLADGA